LFKHTYIFFSFLLFVALTSCKSSKQAQDSTAKGNTKPTKGLSEQDQIKFAFYFVDGCKERMKGNMETAENLFKECLKIDPTSVPTKYELGNIYRFSSLYDNALKYAKECANADTKNEWYQLLLIECLHNTRQYAQAAAVYERLVKNNPYKTDYYEGLAAEQMYAGNFEKSLKTYDELEKKFGQNDAFTLNKIKLLKQLNKYNEAESEFKILIKANPNETRYYTYLAEFYQENKQNDKAIATYNEALKIDPKNPMVHLALADYYKSINDKDNFFKEIKIAFENPDLDADTKLKILISYYQLTEEDNTYKPQAKELLDIMLKVHPTSAEAHSINADFLYRDKKIKEAKDAYLLAIKYDKSKFAIWNQLMYLESELNDYTALEPHSAEAMELFPNQATPYFLNGIANMQLKKYDKAAQSLNEGIEFVYNNNPLFIEFYANLGEAYNNLKNYDKSDKAFDEALKVDPDNSGILNNYAYYLSLRKKQLEKAEKYSRRSNELTPNNRSYIDTYGWILYQLNKHKEADVWLERALKMGTKSAVITEHYADNLYKLEKKTEALKYWIEAKSIGKGSDYLDKKITDKILYE
jgi:tetratricopeptide (TPR) repeat protein